MQTYLAGRPEATRRLGAGRHNRARADLRAVVALVLTMLLVLTAVQHAPAQEDREPLFAPSDALIAGGFLMGAAALAPLDVHLARSIQDSLPQANRYLRTGAGIFRFLGHPGSLAVGGTLYGAGRLLDRPEMAAIGLHTTEAIVIGLGATYLTKVLVGRARPIADPTTPFDVKLGRGWGNDRYQSFPSGHTTAAFAVAAAVSTEMGYVAPEVQVPVAVALFGAAGLAGISRMYHNAHWASDVIVGAAIGTFAGWKVVRYHRTRPGNRVDELFLGRAPGTPTPIVLIWSVSI